LAPQSKRRYSAINSEADVTNLYIRRRDVTVVCGHSMIFVLWGNTAYCVKLSDEDLSPYSNTVESIGLRKCATETPRGHFTYGGDIGTHTHCGDVFTWGDFVSCNDSPHSADSSGETLSSEAGLSSAPMLSTQDADIKS